MRRLVGDLLLLARADANRTAPREPTDVGQVLVEAAAELGPVADGHELDGRRRSPAIVDGVARRAAPDGAQPDGERDPPHAAGHARARVASAARDGDVVLTVEDDGPGVPAELRERVFERFVRGDGDRGSSSGLGLSIVRAVAESHGGTVTLEDADPGARFVVRLPPAGSAQPAEAPAAPEPAPA